MDEPGKKMREDMIKSQMITHLPYNPEHVEAAGFTPPPGMSLQIMVVETTHMGQKFFCGIGPGREDGEDLLLLPPTICVMDALEYVIDAGSQLHIYSFMQTPKRLSDGVINALGMREPGDGLLFVVPEEREEEVGLAILKILNIKGTKKWTQESTPEVLQ